MMNSRDVALESKQPTYRFIALGPSHAAQNDNGVTDKLNSSSQLPVLTLVAKFAFARAKKGDQKQIVRVCNEALKQVN